MCVCVYEYTCVRAFPYDVLCVIEEEVVRSRGLPVVDGNEISL